MCVCGGDVLEELVAYWCILQQKVPLVLSILPSCSKYADKLFIVFYGCYFRYPDDGREYDRNRSVINIM